MPHVRVSVNGVSFHVVDRGHRDRPALVFLHYFAGSARAWEPVVARLEGDYRCVAPDLRGHGDSAAPASGYATADGADDVAALAEAVGLGAYALVGHSMGGKIALALAARRPAGLRALVLVAPSPPTPEPTPPGERARLLATHGDRDAARETARTIVARPITSRRLARVIDDNVRTSGAAWRAWIEGGSREDISASTGAIAVPAVVVAGAADPVFPRDLLDREVVRRLSGARVVVVPEVGHLIPLEAPAEIAEAVRSAVP